MITVPHDVTFASVPWWIQHRNTREVIREGVMTVELAPGETKTVIAPTGIRVTVHREAAPQIIDVLPQIIEGHVSFDTETGQILRAWETKGDSE